MARSQAAAAPPPPPGRIRRACGGQRGKWGRDVPESRNRGAEQSWKEQMDPRPFHILKVTPPFLAEPYLSL